MTQIIELIKKDIKTFITFYMFKRVEERLGMKNSHGRYKKRHKSNF